MNKYTLLIVDDNIVWANRLKSKLEEFAVFEVLQPVYNGSDAIDIIELNKPDIIVLDLLLPVYDGLYITNYIHRQMQNYYPFIYILSAIGSDKINRIIQNLNADYYSVKPINESAVADNLVSLTTRLERQPASRAASLLNGASLSSDGMPASIDISKQVDDYLYQLGAPLYRASTKCLRYALRLALEDEAVLSSAMNLYKVISEHEEISVNTVGAVERNIRTTIKALQKQPSPYYQQCFPTAKRLTNSEFLQASVYTLRSRIENFLSNKGNIV